ncbi:MAG: peptidoglycan DD-metalloendopeptidase family protein, partial [Patescibacteria group bacterium]
MFYPLLGLAGDNLKLPFFAGDNFLISRGYETAPTHVGKESYALDFAKNGCEAFGQPALISAGGRVRQVNLDIWGGGFGNFVLVEHTDGTLSRYAHLSRRVTGQGEEILQGMRIGDIGNTGNVSGTSCSEHPGTHLHFVMYKDGAPFKPEPMSGYTDFSAGEWYVSDNELYDPNRALVEETAARQLPRRTLFAQIGDWIAGLFGNSGTAETTSELSTSGRALAGDLPLSPVPEIATPSEPPAPRSSQTPPAPQSNPSPATAEAAPTNTEETPSVPAAPIEEPPSGTATPPSPTPPAPLQNEPVLSSAPTSTEPTPLPEPTLLDLIIAPVVNIFYRRADSTPPDSPSINIPSIIGTYRTNVNPLVVIGANDHDTENVVVRVGGNEQIVSAWPYNGRWTTVVPLQEGENVIRVAARDGAGNESEERSYTVILDTVPPETPTFTTPETSPFITTDTAIHFEGWKPEDALLVELGFGGSATTTISEFATSTAWSADYTFALGTYDVVARAQDATGNWSSSATLTISVEEEGDEEEEE